MMALYCRGKIPAYSRVYDARGYAKTREYYKTADQRLTTGACDTGNYYHRQIFLNNQPLKDCADNISDLLKGRVAELAHNNGAMIQSELNDKLNLVDKIIAYLQNIV